MNAHRSIRVRWCNMVVLAAFAAVILVTTITPALANGITTCTELQNMSLTGDYYLANDIDCTDTPGWNGGAGFEPIGNESNNFSGTFDGQGYKITGLYINQSSTDFVGLFGFTGSGSEIKDVGLEEVNVSGCKGVGGFVGISSGTITNSYSSGDVRGDLWVGGFVGYNYGGTINNSYSSGCVNGSSEVRCLVDSNELGTITNSYSTGSVRGSSYVGGLVGISSGMGYCVGGFVGVNDRGTINNSYSSGCVTSYEEVGGFVSLNDGTINNSYSSGDVSGDYCVGGFVSVNDRGTINNSYSSGCVSGDYCVGGFVSLNDGTINNSYSSGCVTANEEVGGFVGYTDGTITNCYYPEDDITCTGCTNLIGNTTKANLQNETWLTTSPNDWDFDTVWGIEEGVTYPYLQWQHAATVPPNITSSAPPSPVRDAVCQWRTFSVTINQTVNVNWYLNGIFLFTNESVTDACCTLHADVLGEHNVTAIATNPNGTDTHTWLWTVTQKEGIDLIITDVWYEDNMMYYTITNQGTKSAGASDSALYTAFYRWGIKAYRRVATDHVTALAPGETRTQSFAYSHCRPPTETVRACADYMKRIAESNESNNCKGKTVECVSKETPDLVITDIWYEGTKLYYKIINQGVALAGESDTALYRVSYRWGVKGLVRVATDHVTVLAPGETATGSFNYTRSYSPLGNAVRVCADCYGTVIEASDVNNCKDETL